MRPVDVDGHVLHQVGLPYHWGSRGLTSGGSANDLTHMALDPNTHIQEKVSTCDIRAGRRPSGTTSDASWTNWRGKGVPHRLREPERERSTK
jgi:formate dehydrogenase major subunit